MNQLKAVTYAESREAFFIKMLNKAERGLENLMKYGTSHEDRTEQGQIVSFYRDVLAALRAEEERTKGCEYCWDDEDNEPENIGTGLNMFGQECKLLMHEDEPICVIRFCPRCGRKLDGGGQDARKGDSYER